VELYLHSSNTSYMAWCLVKHKDNFTFFTFTLKDFFLFWCHSIKLFFIQGVKRIPFLDTSVHQCCQNRRVYSRTCLAFRRGK